MSSRPTEPFRHEHEELLEHLEHIRLAAAEIPRLSVDERRAVVGRILGFLRGTLLPHAHAEEEVLYPEWAGLVGFADAAVPMIHDHRTIAAKVDALEAAAPDDVDALQELLYGIHALVMAHFRKEEDIQLPVFDAQPPEAVAAIIERMGAVTGHAHER
jgi:iron-sulfur cluster repair protein YtfE (RIC family)